MKIFQRQSPLESITPPMPKKISDIESISRFAAQISVLGSASVSHTTITPSTAIETPVPIFYNWERDPQFSGLRDTPEAQITDNKANEQLNPNTEPLYASVDECTISNAGRLALAT